MAAWAEWMGADPAKVYKELDRGRQGFPCLLFPEKVHAEGSIAYGAFCKEKLVAFSLLETRPLGEQHAYFNLLVLSYAMRTPAGASIVAVNALLFCLFALIGKLAKR